MKRHEWRSDERGVFRMMRSLLNCGETSPGQEPYPASEGLSATRFEISPGLDWRWPIAWPTRTACTTISDRIRVHFAGEVISAHNLHQFFDASALTSLSEGFPNSIIEAMAASRPVVATSVGGVTDVVVNNVTGIHVTVDDPTPLAVALRMLEADPQLRFRLGQAGREAVRMRFHQEIVMKKLSSFYEILANRRLPLTRESNQ